MRCSSNCCGTCFRSEAMFQQKLERDVCCIRVSMYTNQRDAVLYISLCVCVRVFFGFIRFLAICLFFHSGDFADLL
jgi:hypothetical protein